MIFLSFRAIRMTLITTTLLWSSTVLSAVEIQQWETKVGTKVLFVEAPELPMVDIQITFDAGSVRDNGQLGLANFTAAMIGGGTSNSTETQISDAFNQLGAQFSASASRDNASVGLRSLTRETILIPALKTFTEVISDLKLSDEIIERDRARLLIGIKQAATQASSVSKKALWKNLYGNHPYAHPVSGEVGTVQSITKQQIDAFYSKYYVAQNAQIAIVGALSQPQAKQVAEALAKALPKGQKAASLSIDLKPFEAGTKILEFEATQTHYSLVQYGVERGHPDYHALFLGNHLFGGSGFGSLLMEEVREKRGLVYSVYSYFVPMKYKGPFVVGLSTKNASAYEADKVVKQTLNNFLKDFSDEKFEAIKSNLIGGFPLRVDSNSKKLGYLSMIGFYDMPLSYLEDFPKKIAALSKEDVLKAWNKHIKPEKMLTQMVGRPE